MDPNLAVEYMLNDIPLQGDAAVDDVPPADAETFPFEANRSEVVAPAADPSEADTAEADTAKAVATKADTAKADTAKADIPLPGDAAVDDVPPAEEVEVIDLTNSSDEEEEQEEEDDSDETSDWSDEDSD